MNDTKIAEILEDDGTEDSFKEWLVVYHCGNYVSIDCEYLLTGQTDRRTWQDSGVSVKRENLRALIEALELAERTGAGR